MFTIFKRVGSRIFHPAYAAICRAARSRSLREAASQHLQDKVLELWEVTRDNLEAATAAVRERELELEARQERHAMELKARYSPDLDFLSCTLCLHNPWRGAWT